MESPFLHLNHQEEELSSPDFFSFNNEFSYLQSLDKETLIQVIQTLLNNNDALRKYISILENK